MEPLFWLAERRLEQAERDGAFAALPGRGQPLALEDLSAVPPELRASWILLRTHGLLPPELEARKEWLRLEDLLAACVDDGERPALRAQAQHALLRYRWLLDRAGLAGGLVDYRDQLLARLGKADASG